MNGRKFWGHTKCPEFNDQYDRIEFCRRSCHTETSETVKWYDEVAVWELWCHTNCPEFNDQYDRDVF